MHSTLPLLLTDFPALDRGRLTTLQVNLGYLCNQSCVHCHVSAGPNRTEQMTRETVEQVLNYAEHAGTGMLDLTGGAPELNENFRYLVSSARALGMKVIDRCNLTVLEEVGEAELAEFMALHEVEVVASLPCYTEDNVSRQRGKGVFDASIRGIARLNALGYGAPNSGLVLNLVYNPQGPSLPPSQVELEAEYKRELGDNFGIVFNQLFSLANLPVGRFGSTLISKGTFNDYMALLRSAHHPDNLKQVMCRSLISINWQGYIYDCDFNQMLGIHAPVADGARRTAHISELHDIPLEGKPIAVRSHCFGCTAGQGSSCGGALG